MKLQILMSTYNGEKYLARQLDSLLAQTLCQMADWEVEILVRDDGSQDGTCRILREYAKKDRRIRLEQGENIGVIESFFCLLDASEADADYLAFCDQDDVWMPDKLFRAVKQTAAAEIPAVQASQNIASARIPVLYCSRACLTDENLNPTEAVWTSGEIRPSFGNALIENICIGCTCVMNRSLADILRLSHPAFTPMHDRWFYLVASCFGKVLYDPEAHIYYRQHGGNVVGIKKNYVQELKERVALYKKRRFTNARQAEAFELFCREHRLSIPREKHQLLRDLQEMKRHVMPRFRMMLSKDVYRQRRGDNLIFRLRMLLGDL